MLRWFRRDSTPDGAGRSPDGAADDADDDVPALRSALAGLHRYVNRNAGRLPTAAVVRARWIVDTLGEILDTADTRSLDIQATLTVRGVARDYLPTSLRSYLALGDHPAAASAGMLLEQLTTMQDGATRTLSAARTHDLDALATQGAFLRTKFHKSDLDL
ncbi:hypothetical protein [Spirilliplanes yamanashiensis]|uniref:Uncharacterized protein n=1 Tax=Spirilliplanes yamanashiensis TaxID=42233 RepID=A0A8J4DII8_9ACTN|nr:hypothetical protein [Spirilliplanes yamanashiensis]MDP9817214.1 hypothetical protein [Spirilliplanes yamanashiensis]GIJ03132.1 hypothetical protein Sya03_24840 [Spirilliplanes yamanashiensis]